MTRTLRRLAPFLALLAAGGCAYFNGIYNARQAEHRGDRLWRRGLEGDASPFYATAAAKAETVLVRHGKSGWSTEALYIAGRSFALVGQCDRARMRLDSFLVKPGIDAHRRERAMLALGMCDVRQSRNRDAQATLTPLADSRDREVAAEAALWSARAAMALGEGDAARDMLRRANPGVADWELARTFMAQRRYVEAESLLALRAARGDYRREVDGLLAQLWTADRRDGVQRLTTLYDHGRTPGGARAALHLAVGDLYLADSLDTEAREHFTLSQRLGRDSVPGREAAARLTLLALRAPTTIADVENIIKRGHDATVVGTGAAMTVPALQQRLEDNLLFVQMLLARTDYTGSSLFLAGEVARDSLRALGFAHATFKSVVTSFPNAPVAPKALLAAAALLPDSASAYEQRLRENYPTSPYTLAIDRRDNPMLATSSPADALLQQAWTQVSKSFGDSILALRRAAQAKTQGAATASRTP